MSKINEVQSNLLDRFFYDNRKKKPAVLQPTIALCPEVGDNGVMRVVPKVLELVDNPLRGLSFDDFSLSKCLAAGIQQKDIAISPDFRLGFDQEIDAFTDRLASISDKLFTPISEDK